MNKTKKNTPRPHRGEAGPLGRRKHRHDREDNPRQRPPWTTPKPPRHTQKPLTNQRTSYLLVPFQFHSIWRLASLNWTPRVEEPITNHLGDSMPALEKTIGRCKFFPCRESDRYQEDCKFLGNFIPRIGIIVEI